MVGPFSSGFPTNAITEFGATSLADKRFHASGEAVLSVDGTGIAGG